MYVARNCGLISRRMTWDTLTAVIDENISSTLVSCSEQGFFVAIFFFLLGTLYVLIRPFYTCIIY